VIEGIVGKALKGWRDLDRDHTAIHHQLGAGDETAVV